MKRLLLIDDHTLIAEGLRRLLQEGSGEFRLTTTASAHEGLRTLFQDPCYDMAIVDLDLPDMPGLDAVRTIRRQFSNLSVLIFTGSARCEDMHEAFGAGANGYLLKSTGVDILIQAIRLVLDGGSYIPPQMIFDPAREKPACSPTSRAMISCLTQRQREVLEFVVDGKSNKEIARLLNVAEATVKAHMTALLKTLEVDNRAEAVSKAFRQGWIKQ